MIFKTQSRYYLPTYANQLGEGEIKQMTSWCDLRRQNGQKDEVAAPSSVAGKTRIFLPEKQGKKMLRRQAEGIIGVHRGQQAPSFPL